MNKGIKKNTKKLSRKKLVILLSLAGFFIALVITGFFVLQQQNAGYEYQGSDRGPKPESTFESSFLYQEVGYACSKPIEGEWTEARIGIEGEPGYYFVPKSETELNKFCRTTYAIEYRAVIDILKRDDVSSVIAKYDTSEAWVRALGHTYIHDTAYLDRILPAYSDVKIDCIIVVHSPEGSRFFIEDGEVHASHSDHHYREVPSDEFLASLNNAPDEDVNNFWLGLH